MKVRFAALWLMMGLPLLWGIVKTLENAVNLFK